MKAYKALGLDGFPPTFFQYFWELIKVDLIRVVHDFFNIGKLLKRLNKMFIVLVQKIKNLGALLEFIPISPCNTTYKIFSKIIVSRLKLLLHKFSGKTQNGFVSSHQILDATKTTHEVLHPMEKSGNLGMTLILEISKAYGRINWTFMYVVMTKIGFS